GRRHECLELPLEQPREADTREIAVLRPDDLHAHREPARREPAGRGGRRQERYARVACPEQVIRDRYALAVDHERAFVTLALLVVREGRGAGGGAEKQVVLREGRRPGQAHTVARLVGGEPVAVRRDRRARRAGVVSL